MTLTLGWNTILLRDRNTLQLEVSSFTTHIQYENIKMVLLQERGVTRNIQLINVFDLFIMFFLSSKEDHVEKHR